MTSRVRSWEFDTLQHVTIDLAAGKLTWEDHRRGCEGSCEQALDRFVERGPDIGVTLPRPVALEILAFLGRERTPWCDPSATLTRRVGAAVLPLFTYPPPQPYEGLWLASAVLAEDVAFEGLLLARNTEVRFHHSGRLQLGTLAAPTTLDGRVVGAGARVGFDETGALAFV